MTAVEDSVIELEVRVAARPETVFPFLSDGAKMAQWFGASAELEPRPGGMLRVDINGRNIARGEIVEIVSNQRIAFTFGWEGEGGPVPPGSSRVEISLAADGDGTIVRLRHTGLPVAAAGDHKEGWTLYLGRLTAVAEGRDPGRDPNAQG